MKSLKKLYAKINPEKDEHEEIENEVLIHTTSCQAKPSAIIILNNQVEILKAELALLSKQSDVKTEILNLSHKKYEGINEIKENSNTLQKIKNMYDLLKILQDIKIYFETTPEYKDEKFLDGFKMYKDKYYSKITEALTPYEEVYQFCKQTLEMLRIINPTYKPTFPT